MGENRRELLLKSGQRKSLGKTGLDNIYYASEELAPKVVRSSTLIYEDEINFCISDTNLNELTKTSYKIKSLISFEKKMTQNEFEAQAKKLYKCCLKGIRDLHELHLRRLAGMKVLNDIIRRADPSYIDVPHVIHMTWAIMSCMHHFQLRLRTGSGGLVHYARRKKTESCMKSYSKFIRLFKPSLHRLILNSIIVFYKEGQLWQFEFACTDLIMELLGIFEDAEVAINDILSNAEDASLVSECEAKQLIQVLYEVLKGIKWRKMSKSLIKRFLNILESSIIPKSSDRFNYVPLSLGLQICLRNILDNLSNKDLMVLLEMTLRTMAGDNVSKDILLQFGHNIAQYAASRCKFKILYKNVPMSVIKVLLKLSYSKNLLKVIPATRIWQNLVDRHKNATKLMPPRIYFQDTKYNLKIPKCRAENKLFYKSIRLFQVDICMETWRIALNRRLLEDVYKYHATLITEMPCGMTASTYVVVAMSVQEYAFSISKSDLVRSHHLHALALSLMSLICYVNKAKVFFDYVTTIMQRRAEWAPHLNPPLREKYVYAQHHILWNKPDLFFEDWEVRYGLWKCFKTKEGHRR